MDKGMNRFVLAVVFAAQIAGGVNVPAAVRIEAEDFSDRGGWSLDTQFVHKMGSAYLLAASAGKRVADAETTVEVPSSGVWRCWVRTKDWIPEYHPGKFAVSVGGVESKVLGASGKSGWRWENAGDFTLEAGTCAVRLVDKSGWFARCDAIVLTRDMAYKPEERAGGCDESRPARNGGEYDVVVVGGGTAGTCAALAAARTGARTALVHDRPVLGGNASAEIQVQIEGASVEHPNARETGIIEEAQLKRLALGKGATMSDAFRVLTEGEKNLTVFPNERVMRIEKDGRRMNAVVARGTIDGVWTRYRGKMFIDCTGDGWLGYFAGLPYRTGREARSEFAEAEAPETPDSTTMSGSLSNGRWRFDSVVQKSPVKFETPQWAKVLPEGFTRNLKPMIHKYGGFTAMWWMEHPGDVDDFDDPEFARDELIRYYVAFWGWGKNTWEHRDLLANEELRSVPFMDGRRETRRLIGDYTMTGNDQKSARVFPDRISYGGWPMDTHDPLGMKAVKSDGYWKNHPPLPIYTIPYRVLYSPALDNFFFAGRCQSVTHMALGSIRVMSTLATLGQVCGTAAALCVRLGQTPKEFGARHMAEFQQRLLKDDLYIPALENEDPLDIARTARATASSSSERMYFKTSDPVEWFTKTHHIAHPSKRVGHDGWLYVEGATPQSVVDGTARPVLDIAHGWASDAGKPLPQWIQLDFAKPDMVGEVRIAFNSDLQQRKPDAPMPRTLVKAYYVEVMSGGEWRKVAEVKDNWRRLAVHDFPRREVLALRVTVTETWGDPRAQIFEVRAYDSALGVTIDGDLPAGNVIFDGQEGDRVRIHQDLRDTFCDWFYWAFRVKGAAGRMLTFEFTDKSFNGGPVGVRGPVVSTDGGKTFSYPLDGKTSHGSFTYAFGPNDDEVYFYECHPYGRADWDAFVAKHKAQVGRSFALETLCRSRKGADVPKARFGRIVGEPRHRIFMSARHHCSETMASWVLEGAAEAFMADDGLGRWLRENVELMMVPFADYDGSVAGDQGKCRRPHDHNRDYTAFIYPETKAIADWIGEHADMRLDMFLDFHCPGIRGREHECVHTAFMDPSIRPGSNETEGRFSSLLEKLQSGSMRYRVADDIPFGTSWNNENTYKLGWGSALWACHKVKGAGVARSIEVPFANANGAVVTPQTCRELGRDIAKVIKAYLEG